MVIVIVRVQAPQFQEHLQGALLDGTWLMLKPLHVGDHKIEIHIVQIIPGREEENLFINVTYNLHVI